MFIFTRALFGFVFVVTFVRSRGFCASSPPSSDMLVSGPSLTLSVVWSRCVPGVGFVLASLLRSHESVPVVQLDDQSCRVLRTKNEWMYMYLVLLIQNESHQDQEGRH